MVKSPVSTVNDFHTCSSMLLSTKLSSLHEKGRVFSHLTLCHPDAGKTSKEEAAPIITNLVKHQSTTTISNEQIP